MSHDRKRQSESQEQRFLRRTILKGVTAAAATGSGLAAFGGQATAQDSGERHVIVFQGERFIGIPGDTTQFVTRLPGLQAGDAVPLTVTIDGDDHHLATVSVSNDGSSLSIDANPTIVDSGGGTVPLPAQQIPFCHVVIVIEIDCHGTEEFPYFECEFDVQVEVICD